MGQKMADLPKERILPDHPPFTNMGVDFFGPIEDTITSVMVSSSPVWPAKQFTLNWPILLTQITVLMLSTDLSVEEGKWSIFYQIMAQIS